MTNLCPRFWQLVDRTLGLAVMLTVPGVAHASYIDGALGAVLMLFLDVYIFPVYVLFILLTVSLKIYDGPGAVRLFNRFAVVPWTLAGLAFLAFVKDSPSSGWGIVVITWSILAVAQAIPNLQYWIIRRRKEAESADENS